MVKVSKIKFLFNTKKPEHNVSRPKFLNVVRLAQLSGVEVAENSKTNLNNTQDVLSLFQLQQKLNESKEKFKEIAEKSFSNVKPLGKSLFLDLKEKNITQKVLKQFRNMRLLHKNYLRDIVALFSGKNTIPYLGKLCSDVPTKQCFTVLNDSMITSPRLLVHFIKGENTTHHYMKVKNLKKLYSSCSVEELFNIKRKILKEFCAYTNTDCLIPDFKFSKTKLKKLRQLAAQYDAINVLLKEHNIHTSAIEALFYSGIEKCTKVGDILPNKDVMLGFSSVYDKSLGKNTPVILAFANTDIGYRFKAYRYDENLISNIGKLKKQVTHCIRTKNYKQINDLNNKILEYLKTIEVSEIYVEPKDIDGLEKEMEKCSDMTAEKIASILKDSNNDIVYYIKGLRNFNIKRYYNASIPLINCLKEFGKINKINEAYTEALAFNDVRHSPVGMYIRSGFEPISISKEEIEKELYSKSGFDWKRSVWMVYKL